MKFFSHPTPRARRWWRAGGAGAVVRVPAQRGVCSGSLLILGAPGAGKTTLLLQLASALIDRAKRDQSQPIPVAVNLESWATRRQTLSQWIVDELSEGYGVPRSTASSWMAEGELVLLLDGLDEVADRHRPACAAGTDRTRRRNGPQRSRMAPTKAPTPYPYVIA